MTITNKILEDVTNHMNHLIIQHEKLHKSIDEASNTLTDAQITEMKKKKLKAKDELERMRSVLASFVAQ